LFIGLDLGSELEGFAVDRQETREDADFTHRSRLPVYDGPELIVFLVLI